MINISFLLTITAVFLPTLLFAATVFPHHQNLKNVQLNVNYHGKQPKPLSTSIISSSKRYEGSSDLIHLRYHMGPVLSSPVNLYLIWYGKWAPQSQSLIRDFLLSVSDVSTPKPSLAEWWRTVAVYSDQTSANVTRSFKIAKEHCNKGMSRGTFLTRLGIQEVIKDAVVEFNGSLPVDHRHGVYLVLTAPDIKVQDFCRAVCGFHYFTFPSIVGHTLPYAWIGNSGKQCPEVCAYPFAIPTYMTGTPAMKPPNNDIGVDGMVSVIAHELAELSTNPLINAWYAGEDPTAPTEIGDLCEGVYGSGGGGGYTGEVGVDRMGRRFNVNGRKGRKFLVQWVWNPVVKACRGPNALD